MSPSRSSSASFTSLSTPPCTSMETWFSSSHSRDSVRFLHTQQKRWRFSRRLQRSILHSRVENNEKWLRLREGKRVRDDKSKWKQKRIKNYIFSLYVRSAMQCSSQLISLELSLLLPTMIFHLVYMHMTLIRANWAEAEASETKKNNNNRLELIFTTSTGKYNTGTRNAVFNFALDRAEKNGIKVNSITLGSFRLRSVT